MSGTSRDRGGARVGPRRAPRERTRPTAHPVAARRTYPASPGFAGSRGDDHRIRGEMRTYRPQSQRTLGPSLACLLPPERNAPRRFATPHPGRKGRPLSRGEGGACHIRPATGRTAARVIPDRGSRAPRPAPSLVAGTCLDDARRGASSRPRATRAGGAGTARRRRRGLTAPGVLTHPAAPVPAARCLGHELEAAPARRAHGA
jgi:hypothetical protein